jgi:hypothetical protein
MAKKLNRRNPGDPGRVEQEKKNLRRSRKKMAEVSVAVYIRQDCEKTRKNGSCEYVGVVAKGLEENRYRIKGTHVAKVGIGREGKIHSGYLTALTLLANYEFFEEWDISKPDHQRMIDYAISKPRTKKVAQELKVALLAKNKQPTLFGNTVVVREDAKLLPPQEVKRGVEKTEVEVNGVTISGDQATVSRIVRDLVFDG